MIGESINGEVKAIVCDDEWCGDLSSFGCLVGSLDLHNETEGLSITDDFANWITGEIEYNKEV